MEKAYQLAAAAVRQRFAEQRPESLEVLDSIRKGDVAVYQGSYDSVENVLDRLGVSYTMDPRPRRTSARIVFANCSSAPNSQLTRAIEGKVREGAWLVSSDWSLRNVVEPAFPNTVRWMDGKTTGDEVVDVEPALDSVWSEVVVLGANPQWWLEASSYPIEIVDPERVRVDAASHELLVRYKAPVVAVRFDWHAGHVFHVISHFWLKRSRMPGSRYRGPCSDFLKDGMRLSDEGIQKVLGQAKVAADEINFATIQSAATSTELIAQLCVHARQPPAGTAGAKLTLA